MSAWCRACGQPQPAQSGACSACGVALEIGAPDDSPVGLSFEVRGRMGVTKKQGICVGVDSESLLLHFGPKDKEPGRVPVGTQPTAVVRADLSAAARLLAAADLPEGKPGWDREMLRARSAEMCTDIRVLRRLVDEALDLGWEHIVGWAPLTPSEKLWRRAHHASSAARVDALREALAGLPAQGYADRVALLVPHAAAVHRDQASWRPLLDDLHARGVPLAAELTALAFGPWDVAMGAGIRLLPQERAATWAAVGDQFAAGVLAPPPVSDVPVWTAAAHVLSPDAGQLDAVVGSLAGLERPLWDDLVDAGRVSSVPAVAGLTGALRSYLLARLAPDRLDEDELWRLGHLGEVARRCFLSRDRATLSGLEASPRVLHYQALLDVLETGKVDRRRLDARTVETLEAPAVALEQIKDGALERLPDAVVADPSLWPMFAEVATAGKLRPDPARPSGDALNTWIGLYRLLGLIWEGRLDDAVKYGQTLLPQLRSERVEDEALSLLAYALDATGRTDEGLAHLDKALKGDYTENLLVNASIIASRSRPEVGVRYLARLVEEAPTPELQRAGLSQAITVWESSDLDFPQVMVPALRSVLGGPLPVADYMRFGGIAVVAATDIVPRLPNPGGELDGPYRIIQARAKLKQDNDFTLSDLAEAFVQVYRSVGRPEWFDEEWGGWVSAARENVFVDFGDAAHIAMFIDKVLIRAPELFTQQERFLLAPQAGAHLNAVFAREGNYLNDQAVAKFFDGPIDEFFRVRASLDADLAEHLAGNFSTCLGNAAVKILGAGRNEAADTYNGLVDRLRWDSANRYAIVSQMRRILDDQEQGPVRLVSGMLDRLRRLGSDRHSDLVRAIAADLSEWRDEIRSLRRNL